jgi:hypothetical protein
MAAGDAPWYNPANSSADGTKGELALGTDRSKRNNSASVAVASFVLSGAGLALPRVALADPGLDLTHATLVVRSASSAPLVERTAATVLVEEIEKRTGVKLAAKTSWPATGCAIALISGKSASLAGRNTPDTARTSKAEGFTLATDLSNPAKPVLWIIGADPRGALFGAGRVLRSLEMRKGSIQLPSALNVNSSPDYPIRGHQLGYRANANSYDAWTPEQFDQYIRELALFGANSVEGIPFQDTRPTVNPYPRTKMNVDISRICQKYGQDYWLWAPADFDLGDKPKRAKFLEEHEALFKECPTLTAVFVAGGDPGNNPAEQVIPYLADLAKVLQRHHPKARVWLSMQGYHGSQQDYVYRWIERERPKWLGGLVAGPSAPPLAAQRARLPAEYPIRDYPDITHTVRCQFPVFWWDPAFAFTLGRECVNPRPHFYAKIIHDTAPFTYGFISYSDGIHDDVNKTIWSALEWDRSADLNKVLMEYCRFFFGPDEADVAAAGLFALEKNWEGPLATNGGVDATYALWHELEQKAPELKSNWRWQLCLLRAYYDVYTRRRLRYESSLEGAANSEMLEARSVGAQKAIDLALAVLKQADSAPIHPDFSERITELCDDLYRSIGLQSSVPKYHASGSERGAVLDFLNYPLNNRWWLEDELEKVRKLPTEPERIARLETIAKWENPGPGSFYDDVGNIAKSPHEVKYERLSGPLLDVDNLTLPGFMWWVDNNPLARARQSWVSSEDWPVALKYFALDPQADYLIRTTGCGECLLRVNGKRLIPTLDGKQVGELKEFPIPRGLYQDGTITVTFDPTFEPHLNWRVQSRLSEIWLIRKQP